MQGCWPKSFSRHSTPRKVEVISFSTLYRAYPPVIYENRVWSSQGVRALGTSLRLGLFSTDSPEAFDSRGTIENSFILPRKCAVFIFATAIWITFHIVSCCGPRATINNEKYQFISIGPELWIMDPIIINSVILNNSRIMYD